MEGAGSLVAEHGENAKFSLQIVGKTGWNPEDLLSGCTDKNRSDRLIVWHLTASYVLTLTTPAAS